MKTTYSVRPDDNSIFVLQINGKDCLCPLQPAIPVPMMNTFNQQPQIGFSRMPCGLHCPKASIDNNEEKYSINCCGDGTVEFTLEKEEVLHDDEGKGLVKSIFNS